MSRFIITDPIRCTNRIAVKSMHLLAITFILLAQIAVPGVARADSESIVYAHELDSYLVTDATDALQTAVDSGAKVVVIAADHPWVVSRQINIRDKQGLTLFFEPGVLVEAKKGAFLPRGESLFLIRNCRNILIDGYGAVWRMRKKDYQNPQWYKPAEWRNTLTIRGSDHVTVRGLTLESSGGDGLYIAGSRGDNSRSYCSNILIEDVRALDHHRQGMSVISVDGLQVLRCEFSGTQGTSPEAGIDFEPNDLDGQLRNILIQDCHFNNNAGAGIHTWISNVGKAAGPISIVVERAYVNGGKYGFYVGDYGLGVERERSGQIEFRDSIIRNTRGPGIIIRNKTGDHKDVKVNFNQIYLTNCAIKTDAEPTLNAPLILHARLDSAKRQSIGGVVFEAITVHDGYNRPAIKAVFDTAVGRNFGVANIAGDLTVYSRELATSELGGKISQVNLLLQHISATVPPHPIHDR